MADKERKPRLNLKANVPQEVTFRFGSPFEKEGEYGPYHLWTVAVEGVDHSLLASGELMDKITSAQPAKGTVLILTKEERPEGKKGYDYSVTLPDGTEVEVDPDALAKEPPKEQQEEEEQSGAQGATAEGKETAAEGDGRKLQRQMMNALRTAMASVEAVLYEYPDTLPEGFTS